MNLIRRRGIKTGVGILASIMVSNTFSVGYIDAAKSPLLNEKKTMIYVGNTSKITLKNVNKKAKVSWKLSKINIAKITKKVNSKTQRSVIVKGLKKGKVKLTATYKINNKVKKYTCNLTVKNLKAKVPEHSVVETPDSSLIPMLTPAPTSVVELFKSGSTGDNNKLSWKIEKCNGQGTLTVEGEDSLSVTTSDDVIMSNYPWKSYKDEITHIIVNAKLSGDMSEFFDECKSAVSIDLSKCDTSNVTCMRGLFKECDNLKEINFGNFNTSKVTSMKEMFYGCNKLTKLDLRCFDTSNVTDMRSMFQMNTSYGTDLASKESCLEIIDIGSFDTSSVTDMSAMFSNCDVLKGIDLANFKTSKVNDMSAMFENCANIVELDLKSFDTSNVVNMNKMFKGCSELTRVNLSSFKTDKTKMMMEMFYGCNKLASLDLSNFDLTAVIDFAENEEKPGYAMNDFFYYCTSLKELKTPVNVKGEVKLPTVFYDSEGREYNELPKDREDSVDLYTTHHE